MFGIRKLEQAPALQMTVCLSEVYIALLLACGFFILCLPGCPRPQTEQDQVDSPDNQKVEEAETPKLLYVQSVKESVEENYEQAYYDYRKAVEIDPGLANASHLAGVVYGWVISESEAENVPLLTAQRRLLLTPQELDVRRNLLSVAVDKDKDTIQVFGVGIAPKNVSSAEQKRLLAREAALTSAYVWVARLAMWTKSGVEGPFDVSQKVFGVRPEQEFWIGEEVFAIKVKAPLEKNMPEHGAKG
jgi:hypothetical protein